MPQQFPPDAPDTSRQGSMRFFAMLLLIFMCGVALRWYYMAHKTFVHVDESASITLSTYTAPGWSEHFAEGVVHTGDDLRKLSYTVKPGLSGLASDLLSLRADNRDMPHTNLYYSLLRIALTGMTKWDIHSLLWRGCLLNMFFFCLTFAALYKLGRTLYGEDNTLLLVALTAATLNPAALSSALLVRTYEMQSLTLVLVAWISALYMQRMHKGLPCPAYGSFFLHGLAVALCFLSGYFALFYVALLGLLLTGTALVEKQRSYIPYFICLVVLALVIAWALFSPFMLGLFYDRGAEASQKISFAYALGNAGYILDKFTYMYGKHVTSVAGVAVLVAGAWFSRGAQYIKGHSDRGRVAQSLLLVALLWSLLSFTLAPYKTLRYIMPAAPLVLLLACTFLQQARHRNILAGLFLFCTVPLLFFPGSIEYYSGEERVPHSNTPYVVSLSIPWRTEALVPYITDDQHVIFYNSCESLRTNYANYSGSVLLIDDDQFKKCELERAPELRKEQVYTYFTAYTIDTRHN